MRTSALVRLTTALTAAVLAIALLGVGSANAEESAPPVAVADTVTLWPGQSTLINVLTNDSSPSGDDLALCRFPKVDIFTKKLPSVIVIESPELLEEATGDPGELAIAVTPRARGTHVFDYYICDHTHLVPATLTVVVHEVQPVVVRKVPGKPGRLKVTNHNGRSVKFWYGSARAIRPDGRIRIPAGATRAVRVQRHRINWVALVGKASGNGNLLATPGIIDHGVVRHIKLRGKPLPRPKGVDLLFREGRHWLGLPPGIGASGS